MSTQVTVKRTVAIALMEALGFKTASKHDNKKLARKLEGLEELIDENTKVEDPALDEQLKAILEADKVSVKDDEESEASEGEEKKDKKAKKAKGEKGEKGEKDPKEEKKPTKTLNRIETAAQAVMALTEKTKVKDIVKKADDIYVAAGGKSNLKESNYSTNRAVQCLEAVGLIKVEDNEVSVIGTVTSK